MGMLKEVQRRMTWPTANPVEAAPNFGSQETHTFLGGGGSASVPPIPPDETETGDLAYWIMAWDGPFAMTGAEFTRANSERLTLADNALVSMNGTNFEFSCWVYLTSKPAGRMPIIAKMNGGSSEYRLSWNNSNDRFEFQVTNSASTLTTVVVASTFGAPALATWYHISCSFQQTPATLSISVNDGAANTALHQLATINQNVNDSTGQVELGGSTSGAAYLDGRMQQVRAFRRLLTAGERTSLYAAGAGVREELLPETILVEDSTVYIASWPLDEESGTRRDLRGNVYTLTDVNTVTANHGAVETLPLDTARVARWYSRETPFVRLDQNTHGKKPTYRILTYGGNSRSVVVGDKSRCTFMAVNSTQGTDAQPFHFIGAYEMFGTSDGHTVHTSPDSFTPKAIFYAGGGCSEVVRDLDNRPINNLQSFELAHNSTLDFSASNFCLGVWFYIKTNPGDIDGNNFPTIVAKANFASAMSWYIVTNNATPTHFSFEYSSDGVWSSRSGVGATAEYGGLSYFRWVYAFVTVNSSTGVASASMDDGITVRVTGPLGLFNNTGIPLKFGADNDGVFPNKRSNIYLGPSFLARPTNTEDAINLRCALYNGGAGLRYSGLSAGMKSTLGLVSWWDFNETSGNATDAHGTNHLTAVNSPGSTTGLAGGLRGKIISLSSRTIMCDGTRASSLAVAQDMSIYSYRYDGVGSYLRKNGTGVSTSGDPGSGGVDFGKFKVMQGDERVGFIAAYRTPPSDADRNAVENWGKVYYGISEGGTPPSFYDPTIYGTVQRWYDADDNTVFEDISGADPCESGDNVAVWKATIPTGNQLSNSSATRRPIWTSDNPSYITTSGADDLLHGEGYLASGQFSIYVVLKIDDLAAFRIFMSSGSATGTRYAVNGPTGKASVRILTGGSVDETVNWGITTGVRGIFEVKRDGSNKIDIAFNGGAYSRLFSDAAQAGSATFNRLFSGDSAVSPWSGEINEVLVYSAVTDRTSLIAALKSKWGIA